MHRMASIGEQRERRIRARAPRDDSYGAVCLRHSRWVGRGQVDDACWPHVFGREAGDELEHDDAGEVSQ